MSRWMSMLSASTKEAVEPVAEGEQPDCGDR